MPGTVALGSLARAGAVMLVSCVYVAYVFQIHHAGFWSAGLGDWMDPYFINAVLEHWYRAAGNLSDPSSPPMFYPATKTLGYSHGLILFAPFYVVPRLVLHPFVAENVALTLMMETGIVCLYLLLRRFRLSFVEALLLTIFFFSSQNVINGGTGTWAQRFSVFLIPPILLLLADAMTRRTGAIAVALAGISGLLATLLYAQDVYTAHLASLLVACAAIGVVLVDVGLRRPIAAVRTFWRTQSAISIVLLAIAIGAGGWALAIATLGGVEFYIFGLKIASHAWRRPAWLALIASIVWFWMNRRVLRAYAAAVPRPRFSSWLAGFAAGAVVGAAIVAWIYLGAFLQHGAFPEDNLLNSLPRVGSLSWNRPIESIQAMCIYDTQRPFMLTIALAGLAWLPWFGIDGRLRRYLLWMLAVSALVFLIPLRFGDVSVWRMLIEPLPGFGVIRDPRRIIYLYELAVVVAIALLMAALPERAMYRKVTVALVVLLLATSWNRESFAYSRPIETFEKWVSAPIDVDRSCRSFYIKGASDTYMARSDHKWTLYGVDATFVAFELGVPTLNGYSALTPEGWELANPQEPTYAERVARWITLRRLTHVCELDIETRVMRRVTSVP